MPVHYIVEEGDCLSSIAHRYGLLPQTIWNDPANEELKKLREDMNVLAPGDVVYIRDKYVKEAPAATDRRHKYKRKGTPVKFRVRLIDEDVPLAGVGYTLQIDFETFTGKADADGMVECWIPASASEGRLTLEDGKEYSFRLGVVDPVTEEAGVRKRLQNLHLLEADGGDLAYRNAMQRFRELYCGAPPLPLNQQPPSDDEFTDEERAKLVEVHGS